jgi:hypothetical protein
MTSRQLATNTHRKSETRSAFIAYFGTLIVVGIPGCG